MRETTDTADVQYAPPTPQERLRQPFPAELVSKLPATAKRPELDYVGHAAVTDRLLQVDPQWAWTWGVEDPLTGRPSKTLSLTTEPDGSISLWMALTVGGVTRVDVGYAPAAKDEALKHAVSDALRRCAMRHGVALDLWMKDRTDDHAAHEAAVPCPVCGKALRERTGSRGAFIGCSGYPECRFTREGSLADYATPADGDTATERPSAPTGKDQYQAAQLGRLLSVVDIEAVKKVFADQHASAVLAPTANDGWKVRGTAWKELGQEAREIILENLLGLAADAEIPF